MGFTSHIFGKNKPADNVNSYSDVVGITDQSVRDEIEYFLANSASSGISDRLFGIYPIIGNSFEQFKYNLLDPRDLDEALRLVEINAPTYNNNSLIGTGSTNLRIPIKAADLFEPYSYHMGYYSKTQLGGNNTLIVSDSITDGRIRLLMSGNTIINDGYNYVGNQRTNAGLTVSTGFIVAERTSDKNQKNYHQGIKKADYTYGAVTTQLSDHYIKINAQNLECGFVTIGNHLSEAQNAELNRLVNRLNIVLNR